MQIEELVQMVMQQAKEKGFGTTPQEINVAEKIALLHSEVTEAYDAYRHQNIDGKNGFKEELGDVIQRALHLCGIFQIDVSGEITKKIADNKARTWDWKKLNEGE